jgi:hypothetical protein
LSISSGDITRVTYIIVAKSHLILAAHSFDVWKYYQFVCMQAQGVIEWVTYNRGPEAEYQSIRKNLCNILLKPKECM